MSVDNDDFFIGYEAQVPLSLQGFLRALAALVVVGSAALALLLGTHQGEGGDGGFDWAAGPKTVVGIVRARPYPVVHTSPDVNFPDGHTYLLSYDGKRGVQGRVVDGTTIEAGGFVVRRGALDMLVVDGEQSLKDVAIGATAPKPIDLGRWRMQGEICDGKCYAGAMRPGIGLAHKACANLCILGGIPPVFVTSAPVTGTSFFLLGDSDGNALGNGVLDHVGILIQAEGRVEQRGDLRVFKMDTSTLRVSPR